MLTIKYKYAKMPPLWGGVMIQNGDKFTVLDLCESVRSVTSADLRKHVACVKSSPDEYAKKTNGIIWRYKIQRAKSGQTIA